MDKKIKIVRQVVEVMTPDKGITRSIPMYYLYMWYADEWCFLHLMREDDCDNLSVFIAEGLIDFGEGDFLLIILMKTMTVSVVEGLLMSTLQYLIKIIIKL